MGQACFRDRSVMCMRPTVEKQCENGIKQVQAALRVTRQGLIFNLSVVSAIKMGMPVSVIVAQFAHSLEWKNSGKTGENR